MSAPTAAVIDIGSNSIKLLVAHRAPDGNVTPLTVRSLDARISTGINAAEPRLNEEGIRRGLDAIRTLLETAAPFAPARTILVATSAVRDAANGAEFRAHVLAATGHDLRIHDPIAVSLEIDLLVCVHKDHFRSDVSRGLLDVLSSRTRADGTRGLFHPDHFSFGQTVFLSPLYAAARTVAGVGSVQVTRFQRQGQADPKPLADGFMTLGRLEIVRLDNDPNFPEHGVLRLELHGGK